MNTPNKQVRRNDGGFSGSSQGDEFSRSYSSPRMESPEVKQYLNRSLGEIGSSPSILTPCRRIGLSRSYKSPIGKPSSNPLLTPCRRIGLSRRYKGLSESPAGTNEKNNHSSTPTTSDCTSSKNLPLPEAKILTFPKESSPIKRKQANKNDNHSSTPMAVDCLAPKNIILIEDKVLDRNDKEETYKLMFPNENTASTLDCPTTTNLVLIEANKLTCPNENTLLKSKRDIVEASTDDRPKADSSQKNNKKVQKRNRLSLKRRISDDDEDEVLVKLRDEVEELDRGVKEREDTLTRMRLSVICKEKHNVAELTGVIDKWKNGCETVLRRLLGKVKERDEIDMNTLMAKFGVSRELLEYHAETDEFTWV